MSMEMDLKKLDALVAEKVMGYEKPKPGTIGEIMSLRRERKYSTDIAAAWEVVENSKLLQHNCLYKKVSPDTKSGWAVTEIATHWDGKEIVCETAPLAICLFALYEKGIDVSEWEK